MKTTQAQAHDALVKARAHLVVRHPFFGCLALRLDLVESDAAGTMATDGKAIYYNSAFVLTLTLKELASVIAHEVLHVACKHHTRRGNRDPRQFNIAADYAINGILVKAGLFNLPDGGLYDPQYVDWGAERIYADLPKPDHPQQQQPQASGEGESQPGDGEGQPGDEQQAPPAGPETGSGDGKPAPVGEVWDAKDPDGNDLSPADIAEIEREIDTSVRIAAQAEKSIGAGSRGVAGGILKGLGDVDVNWGEVLKDHILETVADDYTFDRPNRRYIAQGLYLPAADETPRGELAFAIDVSCSLSKEELEADAANINDIIDTLKPLRTHVIYCDSAIVGTDTYESGDPITLKHYEGGGTAFAPPFNWCLANDITPDVLVYFTDGYGEVGGWPELDAEPDYPVIWATTGTTPGFRGNEFGDVIEI